MIKSILFPTDFSGNAKNATTFAVEIAKLTGAKLNLLHVYEVPYPRFSNEIQKNTGNSPSKDYRENVRQLLQQIIVTNQLTKHPHRNYIREGSLLFAVENISKTENIDLIIIGQKGANRSNNLFGSNCLKIIINSPCAVLTVPSGSHYKSFSHITYLIDLDSKEDKQLEQLQRFADLFGARITLLHIGEERATDIDKKNKADQLSNVSSDRMDHHIFINDDFIDGVQNFVDNNKVDLLVMKTKSTSLFDRLFGQSLTEEMMNYVKLPLLVFS